MNPDDFAVLPYVALLHLVLWKLPRSNAPDELQAGWDIFRMREVLDLEPQDFFARVARDLAIALIYGDPLFIERQMRDADCRLLEGREKEMAWPAKGHSILRRPARDRGRRGKHRGF